jgi:uncharacterized protein YukE
MENKISTVTKIEDVKENLVKVDKDINRRIMADLKDSWKGEEANVFAAKLEDVSKDIKKIMYKLDDLKNYDVKHPIINIPDKK